MKTALPRFRRLALAGTLVAAFAALAVVWKTSSSRSAPPSGNDNPPGAVLPPEQDPSLATVRHVVATGGCPPTREAAIAWLDQQSRHRRPLAADAESFLLDMLRDGRGHPGWPPGYHRHLFNSACNALRVRPGDGGESLARILHSHASSHPDRVLRLYALQHLDSLRKSGHLVGVPAEEIRATLESLAAEPDGDVAGTAILLLTEWDGAAGNAPPAILELAAHTAADRTRPVDVRVSAIHSAGPAALDAARAIAADPTEPVLLRKAAIARIGRHGGEGDLPALESLRGESSRLAQAAEPALGNLRQRLREPAAPAPVPYP